MTCVTDYSVITNKELVVIDTAEKREKQVVVEYFVQPDKPENLDVLFILDTSCSMSDNFENVDYQMGIINSSMSEQYFAGPFDKDSTAVELFMAPYFLDRDRFEELFSSLYIFTTTPEGQEFLRPNVDKLYVFISDEHEQSPIPVDIFKDWMDDYNSDVAHDVVVIGISDTSSEECRQFFYGDFQLALADSSFLLTPISYKKLDEAPLRDSIVVYKDGIVQQDWYFLENTNTVYFEFEIEPNSIIKIGYISYL
jgi:hypothetical protein